MSDEKQLSFSVHVDGVSNEADQLAKITLEVAKLTKAKQDLIKSYKDGKTSEQDAVTQLSALTREINTQKDAQSGLKKVIDSAPDSLNRMRQSLIDLKDQYANGSSALRDQLTPQIQKLTGEVSTAEQAIGVHSRGVGSYTQSILAAGKQLFMFMGITASFTAAMKIGKEIIDSTQGSMSTFKVTMSGVSTATEKFFQMIATADLSNFYNNLEKAFKAGKDYAEALRQIEERQLGLSLEQSELQYKATEYMRQARDNSLTAAERQEALNEYKKIENKLGNEGLNISSQAIIDEEKKLAGIGIQASKLKELYENYNTDIETIKSAEEKSFELRKLHDAYIGAQRSITGPEAFRLDAVGAKKAYDDLYNSMTDEEKHYADLLSVNDKVKKGDLTTYIGLLIAEGKSKDDLAEIDKTTQKTQNAINTVVKATNKELDKQLTKTEEIALKTSVAITGGWDKKNQTSILQPFNWTASDEVAAVHYSQKVKDNIANIGNLYDKGNQKVVDNEKKAAEATLQIDEKLTTAKINIANSTMNLLNAIAGKNKTLQKAVLITDSSIAIAEIIIKAKAAAMATTAWGNALSGPSFGASVIAAIAINTKNKISEYLNIGEVIAATAVGLAGLSKGGYTKHGPKYEPAGIVHAGEWVATQEMVKSPVTGPIISALERSRMSFAGSGVMNRMNNFGYAQGGFIGSQTPHISPAGFNPAQFERYIEATNNRFDRLEVIQYTDKVRKSLNEVEVNNQTNRI